MALYLSAVALPAYATSRPMTQSNNMDWDVLYVVAGLLLFLLIVIGAATLANTRDDRRHPHMP